MSANNKFKVGDKVFYLRQFDKDKNPKPTEGTITKVGREYIYFQKEKIDMRKVFKTMSDFHYVELSELWRIFNIKLRNAYDDRYAPHGLTKENLIEFAKMLGMRL